MLLCLFTWQPISKALAQCTNTYDWSNVQFEYIACGTSSSNYHLGIKLSLPYNLKAPFTYYGLKRGSSMVTNTVTITDSCFYIDSILVNPSITSYENYQLYVLDSCDVLDTIGFNISYSNAMLHNIYGVNYNHCNNTVRFPMPIDLYSGIASYEIFKRDETTYTYSPVTNPVTFSGDSIIVDDIFLPTTAEYSTQTYQLKLIDSCGRTVNYYFYPNTDYYYYYNWSIGEIVCGSPNISNIKIKLNQEPPYLVISNSLNPYYTIPESDIPVPVVTFSDDTMILNNVIPFVQYQYYLLGNCGDTFKVDAITEFDPYVVEGIDFKALPFTCDTTVSMYYIEPEGMDFYDFQMVFDPMTYEAVLPTITTTKYGDSVVISGLPRQSYELTLKARDSICHTDRYFYAYPFTKYASSDYPYLQSYYTSCDTAEGFVISGNLMGVPPFTFNLLAGLGDITFNSYGDSIVIKGFALPIDYSSSRLLSFEYTDACGITDTISANFYNTNNYEYREIKSTGGCDGMNNATFSFTLGKYNYLDGMSYYTKADIAEYSIVGPGSPTIDVVESNFIIENLTPESDYIVYFTLACGENFVKEFTSKPANDDITFTIKTLLEGHCLTAENVNEHLGLYVFSSGLTYPYTAYLSGAALDTIVDITSDTFKFSGLEPGSYTITAIDYCNNIYTQTYVLSSVSYSTSSYINSFDFINCDTARVVFYTSIYSAVDYYNITRNRPQDATIISGTDTMYYEFDYDDSIVVGNYSLDTAYIHIPSTVLNHNFQFSFDMGCGSYYTSTFNKYYGIGYSNMCADGENFNYYSTYNHFTPSLYPIKLEYLSGTYDDTSDIYIEWDEVHTWNMGIGENILYNVYDNCGRFINVVGLYPPTNISYYTDTRICSSSSMADQSKGNAYITIHYTTSGTEMKYKFISGPQVLFDSAIFPQSKYFYDIDTGTYVFEITENNECSRTVTATMRVEPFKDSISYTMIPGCIDANTLVVNYYSNRYSSNYHNIINESAYYSIYGTTPAGEHKYYSNYAFTNIYNIPSNTSFSGYINNSCRSISFTTPSYQGPQIKASAGFTCADGFSIAILGNRGVPPYTYEILSGSPVSYSAPEQSSNIFTGLPAISGNTYQVRLKDQCGNAYTTLVSTDSMNLPLFSSGFACIGSNYTASVDSIPNVTYQWNGPDGFSVPSRTFTLNPVTEADTGEYILSITNNITGCVTTIAHNVQIVDCNLGVEAAADTILCYGDSTATVHATAFGGLEPYSYSWNTGSTNDTLYNMPAGTYIVTVTDGEGNIESDTIEVIQIDSILIEVEKENLLCHGDNNGSISTTITGGVGPYFIQWSNDSTTNSINNLVAGDYTITVTDQNGCVKTKTITIEQPDSLVATLTPTNILCNGDNNGIIAAIPSGGVAPYTYSWSNGGTDSMITDLTPGTYQVTITDANGCTYTSPSQTISQPSSIIGWFTSVTEPICLTGNNGIINTNTIGGTSPYTYSWNTGATTKDITNLESGDYILTISDYNGCELMIDTTLVATNCLPYALIDSFTTDKNTPITGSTVADNDTLSGDGNNVWTLTDASGNTANGTVTMDVNGAFVYTPNTGYVGIDSFEYQVCDATGDCATAMAYIIIQSPLNVQLTDFYGMEQNCDVHLFWEISEASSISKFEIERSNDGRTFQFVSNEYSKVNILNYSFIDKINQKGEHYYRLKMIDADGSISYSKSLPIMVECVADRIVKVYPTVSNSIVNIEGANEGEWIKIYDASGRLMMEQEINSPKASINIQNLAAGMYQLFLVNKNEQIMQFKIIRE